MNKIKIFVWGVASLLLVGFLLTGFKKKTSESIDAPLGGQDLLEVEQRSKNIDDALKLPPTKQKQNSLIVKNIYDINGKEEKVEAEKVIFEASRNVKLSVSNNGKATISLENKNGHFYKNKSVADLLIGSLGGADIPKGVFIKLRNRATNEIYTMAEDARIDYYSPLFLSSSFQAINSNPNIEELSPQISINFDLKVMTFGLENLPDFDNLEVQVYFKPSLIPILNSSGQPLNDGTKGILVSEWLSGDLLK